MIPLLALALMASGPAPAAAAGAPTPEMQKLLQDCSAHKFEAQVDVVVDGSPRKSRVKLCGTQGQSDADWIRTLKDAVAKVEANPEMSPEMRSQIVTAINGELARLNDRGIQRSSVAGSSALIAAPGLSLRPPLPAPRRAANSPPLRPLESDYASLPPLPAPKVMVASSAIGAGLPSLPRPRMTIRCTTTEDRGASEACDTLGTNTLLTIRADEALSGDTSLRFVRKGDARGDVVLRQMRQGQSVQVALPRRLCAGVVRSRVQIEVLRRPPGAKAAEQVVDTLGPYDLRC